MQQPPTGKPTVVMNVVEWLQSGCIAVESQFVTTPLAYTSMFNSTPPPAVVPLAVETSSRRSCDSLFSLFQSLKDDMISGVVTSFRPITYG